MKRGYFLTFVLLTSLFLASCQLKPADKNQSEFEIKEEGSESAMITDEIATPAGQILLSPNPSSSASTSAEKSDKEAIREFFSRKYSRPVEEIFLTIDKKTEDFAGGTVRFIDELGGGWWLAAKTGKTWQVVADGNGTVSCSSLEGYNFPGDLVPECYDHESGEMVNRK